MRRWGNPWTGLGLALAACGVLAAQSTITGRLLQKRGDQRLPLTDCTVFARSIDNGPLVGEYPNHKGDFRLDFSPDARVNIGTICPGYHLLEVNGRRTLPPTHDCSSPGHCAAVEITLEPLAVIEGYVVDPSGMPVEGMQLELRQVIPGQRPRSRRAGSDDQGYFRFFHLSPGEYELEPIVRGGPQDGPVWQGDVQRIGVEAGDVVSAGQVRLRELQPVELTGRIMGLPEGTAGVHLTLSSGEGNHPFSHGEMVQVDAEGRFRLPGVPPGKYQLTVNLPGEEQAGWNWNQGNYIGSVDLTAAAGEVTFQRQEPGRIAGSVVIEQTRREDVPFDVRQNPFLFSLVSEDGVRQSVQAQPPEHTFELGNLRPGVYRLEMPGGPRMSRRADNGEWEPVDQIVIRSGAATTLELRARFELGRMSVVVKPAPESDEAKQGLPAAHYIVGFRRDGGVMLFPTDQNGLLVMRYFSGGDYEVCAWREMNRERAQDPAVWRDAGDAVRRFRHEEGVDMEITLTAAP